METIFKSPITTKRHKEHGFCEDTDFGQIELIELSPAEKKLIVSFMDYDEFEEFIEYKGCAFRRISKATRSLPFGQKEEVTWASKQGKFSRKTAVKLVLELRSSFDDDYSGARSQRIILIGRTIYVEYCKIKDLTITVASNMLFSSWITIDIESHPGKVTIELNKRNFEKVFKEQKARFEKDKPKKGQKVGDGDVRFSYPKQIVWGKDLI